MSKPEPRTEIVMLRMSPAEVAMLDDLVQSTGTARPVVLRTLLRQAHAKLERQEKPKARAKR